MRLHQLVVDSLADAVDTPPPPGLWDAIRSSIDEIDDTDDTDSGAVDLSASGRTWRRPERRVLLSAAAIVAVVAIAGATVFGLARSDAPTDSIAAMTAMANDAARQPGSRTGVLTDPDNTMSVKVVVDAEGHGFVMTDPLPELPADETYQLWSATDGEMVSLGMLGSNPRMSLVSIDAAVTELAITREPARGSVAPTSGPMATGRLV
ncbi:MAG: anti-sigma factor domain-containing protein [Acidimicrobiia bacterium]